MNLKVHIMNHFIILGFFHGNQLVHSSIVLFKLLYLLLILPSLRLQGFGKQVNVVIELINVHSKLVLNANVRPHITFELLDHFFVFLKHVGVVF